MDTRCPCLLGNTGNQLFHLLADDHHHIGKLIDHHHNRRQVLQIRRRGLLGPRLVVLFRFEQRVFQRLSGLAGLIHLTVIAGQVANPQGGHQLVTPLHFPDAPAQAVGGVFHIGNDRGQQVRNALIDRQLQHLRVHQHQSYFVRRGFVQQAEQHHVHAHGFPRASGTRHQQVGHFGQIRHDGFAGDIVTQGHGEHGFGLGIHIRGQHFTQAHDFPVLVGNLNPHHRFAGNHFHHPHADHRQRTGQVFGQIGNPAGLDPGGGLNLEPGHHRPGLHRDHLDLDPEVLELQL